MFPMTIGIHISDANKFNQVVAALASVDAEIKPVQVGQQPEQTTGKKSMSASTPAKPAPTPRTAEVGADAAPASKGENSAPEQAGDAQPERRVVAEAIKQLAPKNRDALVEILAKHGGKHLNDISADKWAALLADLKKALA
ncbi:hypothetical protein G3T20_05450 [Bordetella hinzii]|uniref:hypothetical protein n=1 Tax=Bordetella hinzii TaxID=103855 RepID=UPI0013EFFF3C|nr:hypothetical protein [Bordetella hinzii]QII84196.1 hypothetical protein G3T20_05450 [Bordetella hinzii]